MALATILSWVAWIGGALWPRKKEKKRGGGKKAWGLKFILIEEGEKGGGCKIKSSLLNI